MEIPRLTLDTHSLIWYAHQASNHLLSAKALKAIQKAESSGIIYVPTIVLVEILDLIERGKIPISISFHTLFASIEGNKSYQVVPFDADLLKALTPLKGLEIHDRLIAATAIMTESILVTKDRVISASGVNVLW